MASKRAREQSQRRVRHLSSLRLGASRVYCSSESCREMNFLTKTQPSLWAMSLLFFQDCLKLKENSHKLSTSEAQLFWSLPMHQLESKLSLKGREYLVSITQIALLASTKRSSLSSRVICSVLIWDQLGFWTLNSFFTKITKEQRTRPIRASLWQRRTSLLP